MVGQYSSCHTHSTHKDLAVSKFKNKRSAARLGAAPQNGKSECAAGTAIWDSGGQLSSLSASAPSTVDRPPSRPSLPPRARHPIRDRGRVPEIGGPPLHPPISLLIGKSDIGLAGACSVCSTAAPPTLPSVHVPEYIEAPSRLYGTSRHLGRPFMLCFQLDRLSR